MANSEYEPFFIIITGYYDDKETVAVSRSCETAQRYADWLNAHGNAAGSAAVCPVPLILSDWQPTT